MRLLSIPLAALLALTLVPWLALRVARTWLQLRGQPEDAFALATGVLLAAALVWWRRPNWLVHTLIHEACHALVATVLLVRVRAFQASDGQGGAVLHDRVDWPRTVLIAIAPYTLPLLLLPALLAQETVPLRWRPLASFAVGALAVHHLHGLWHNVRLNFLHRQADLPRVGRLLSLVLISAALLATAELGMRVMGG